MNRSCLVSMVFGGKQKLRFLAGEKTPEFAKFQCENAGKNFALFCACREHWWLVRLPAMQRVGISIPTGHTF